MRLMIAHRPGKKRPLKYWCFCGNYGLKYIFCMVCTADIQKNRLDHAVNRCWRKVFRCRYLHLMPLPHLVSYAKTAGQMRDLEGFRRIRLIVRQHHGEAAEARVMRHAPKPPRATGATAKTSRRELVRVEVRP